MKIETKCELGKYYYFIDYDTREVKYGKCVSINPRVSMYYECIVYNIFDTDEDLCAGSYDDSCFENLAQCCLFIKEHPEYGKVD